MQHVMNLRGNFQIPKPEQACRDLPDGATVYVIGDLEGRLHVLYNLMLHQLKLIERLPDVNAHGKCTSAAFKWIGDEKTFVVQCGDQVDQSRHDNVLNPDLQTLMFTDYLQEISGGRFVNILGNHEWMNVLNITNYVHDQNAAVVAKAERAALFQYDGLLGRVLRRRSFLVRLNNALFSHAGVQFALPGGQSVDGFVKETNGMALNKANWDSSSMTPEFKERLDKPNCDGIMWYRGLSTRDVPTCRMGLNRVTSIVPEGFNKEISVMVIGHNKDGVMLHSLESGRSPVRVLPTAALQLQQAQLSSQLQYLVSVDNLFPTHGDQVEMQYAQLAVKEKRIAEMTIRDFKCANAVCEIFPEKNTFRDDYLQCAR